MQNSPLMQVTLNNIRDDFNFEIVTVGDVPRCSPSYDVYVLQHFSFCEKMLDNFSDFNN